MCNSPVVQFSPGATVSVGNSAAAPVPVRDVDAPGRQPFQASLDLNISGVTGAYLPIPAGKRFVVEFVAINCAAASLSGAIQPKAIFSTSLAGSASANFYLPALTVPTSADQFANTQQVKLYADQLSIGLAYSGYAPSFLVMHVAVSGYLIDP